MCLKQRATRYVDPVALVRKRWAGFAYCEAVRARRQRPTVTDSSRHRRAFAEPLLDQRGQRAVRYQRRLCLLDRVAQRRVSLAHANAEALAGDTGLDDPKLRAVAHEPFGYRRELHEGVAAAGRQVVERVADLVIGVDAHARGTMLGNELVGDRLAGIALLHADHQAFEVGDAMHARMTARIDNEGLAGDHIGCAEIDDPSALRRNRRAGSNAVIGAGSETGEEAVEVGALVRHQLPLAAEFFGDALHQRDIEAGRAVLAREFE